MSLFRKTHTFTWTSATRPPLPFVENGGYTTAKQVTEVIQGLERHQVRYILWSPQAFDILPTSENPSGDHLGPLRDYIHNHYTMVKVFPDGAEIWEKTTT